MMRGYIPNIKIQKLENGAAAGAAAAIARMKVEDYDISQSGFYQQFLNEHKEYSITPRTWSSRTFLLILPTEIETKIRLNKDFIDLQKQTFATIKQVTATLNEAEKKGLMVECCDNLKAAANSTDAKIKFTEEFNEELKLYAKDFLKEDDGSPRGESTQFFFYNDHYRNGNDNEVTRFGVNIDGVQDCLRQSIVDLDKSKDKKPPPLHIIEVHLMSLAIKELYGGNPSIKKTVLVDIFTRDIGGSIKKKHEGDEIKLEMHTVALVKINDTTCLIIDPSNSDFSQHINAPGTVEKIRLFDGSLSLDKSFKFVALKDFKIYSTPPPKQDSVKLTGFEAGKYRDCVDIAVKLAFGFNLMSCDKLMHRSGHAVEMQLLRECLVVQQITNHQDSIIPDFVKFKKDGLIARIRQVSNDDARATVDSLMIALDDLEKNIRLRSRSLVVDLEIINKIRDVFKECDHLTTSTGGDMVSRTCVRVGITKLFDVYKQYQFEAFSERRISAFKGVRSIRV